jgi:pyrroloquinoline quinone biosynthesis protein B
MKIFQITLFFLLTGFVAQSQVKLVVLGTTQDAGSPQAGCKKECCKNLFDNPDETRKVVSLGLIDETSKQKWLFEATPDFPAQIKMLKNSCSFETAETPDGIFVSHGHIGHYTGLMYLGKEAMGAKDVSTYVMPRMKDYLTKNGPWSQLVKNKNIVLEEVFAEKQIVLSYDVSVIPFLVPHRDEYTETIGFKIITSEKSVLFIPDIDKWEKWEKWEKEIIKELKQVDYAFLDATFFDGDELPNRNMNEIPHPFVVESMKLFQNLEEVQKKKIYFIHFNHTNPLLNKDSEQFKQVLQNGFNVAEFGNEILLID